MDIQARVISISYCIKTRIFSPVVFYIAYNFMKHKDIRDLEQIPVSMRINQPTKLVFFTRLTGQVR